MVGRIGPAHGLQGTVVVDPETDDPARRFAPGSVVFLADGQPLTVVDYQETDRSPLVTFQQVSDRSTAEEMRGQLLHIAADQRRPLEADEFWPDEMVGMAVETADGRSVGVVEVVEAGLAQDRVVVTTDDGRRFTIPLVQDLVPSVDMAGRRLVIDPPAGLVD